MKTTGKAEQTRIKISGEITDKARLKSNDDEKVSKLFFSLLDKPIEYLKKLKAICQI